MFETCWSDFKRFNVKFYKRALVDIIKVILRSAPCNNTDAVKCLLFKIRVSAQRKHLGLVLG